MKKYHKIQSVYKRDPDNNMKTFLIGQYSTPEIEYLSGNLWSFTEKIDGTNIRIGWDGEKVSIGGRTDNAQIPTFLLSRLNELFQPITFSAVFEDSDNVDVTLYGEGYGAKIQKGGGLYLPDRVDFILFDIRIGDWWMTRDSVDELAEAIGCDSVPRMSIGTIDDAVDMVSRGFKSAIGKGDAEGIVMRPLFDLSDRGGRRIICKLKTKDFR